MQEPLKYFLSLQDVKHPFCLYSGKGGRFSYVGVNPLKIIKIYPHFLDICGQKIPLKQGENPFDLLSEEMKVLQKSPGEYFRSGWVGFWAYEMASFADANLPKRDLPEDFLLGWWGYYEGVQVWENEEMKSSSVGAPLGAPKVSSSRMGGAASSAPALCRESYFSSLSKILSYIEAGDCYQVNFSQQFELPLPDQFSPKATFVDLAVRHPAPFSAYLDCGEKKIISLSPEEFIFLKGDTLRTSPIKGTRKRSLNVDEDAKLKKDLENSEKEKAELLMIVDLERNDLGKICEPASIQVKPLRQIVTYDYVYHAEAVVEGKIKANVSPLMATRAMFPGGSITGAPKKRAMEIIQELELEPRGIYTGAIGFYDVSGLTNLNIAIRSFEIEKGKIRFGMGGGIVADSDPLQEYEELFVKAKVFDELHYLSK